MQSVSHNSVGRHHNTHVNGWASHRPSTRNADVPQAVRNLLGAMRQLQDSLRLWSDLQVSESQVSDVFVRVGTEFNRTMHAFSCLDIDMSEVHSFSNELRVVLEQCLSEDASSQVYEIYVPQVRQIFYKLLLVLRSKQQAYWRVAGGRQLVVPADA